MEEVQRDVLSWDFFSIASGKSNLKSQAGGVPTQFEGLEHYSRVFWALLLEELRAHIQQVVLKPSEQLLCWDYDVSKLQSS